MRGNVQFYFLGCVSLAVLESERHSGHWGDLACWQTLGEWHHAVHPPQARRERGRGEEEEEKGRKKRGEEEGEKGRRKKRKGEKERGGRREGRRKMRAECPKQHSQSIHHFLQFFFSFAHSLSIVAVNYKNQALKGTRKDSFQTSNG